MVDDQDKALRLYTEIPMGEAKWLTLVSPEGPQDIELVLEPMGIEAAKTYQKALLEAGISLTAWVWFSVERQLNAERACHP